MVKNVFFAILRVRSVPMKKKFSYFLAQTAFMLYSYEILIILDATFDEFAM
jgi:hypothetical protein